MWELNLGNKLTIKMVFKFSNYRIMLYKSFKDIPCNFLLEIYYQNILIF